MSNAISFSNPAGVHAPAGAYTHGVTVSAHAKVLYVSGQIGVRPDGLLGASLSEQADQAYRNLGVILEANGFHFTDIVKLTTYIVSGQPGAEAAAVRRSHHDGSLRPRSMSPSSLRLNG